MAGGGVGEAMLISAITGAGTSAVTGGDPLKGALLGAATGGVGAGVAGGASGAAASQAAAPIVEGTTQAALQEAANQATQQSIQSGLQTATQALPGAGADAISSIAGLPLDATGTASLTGAPVSGMGLSAPTDMASSLYTPSSLQSPYSVGSTAIPSSAQASMTPPVTPTPPTTPPTALEAFYAKNPIAMPAGLGALGSFIGDRPGSNIPGEEEYSGPLSRFRYDPDKYRPRRAASGGLMDTMPAKRMAGGGLGSYSDGGQLLKGPGDGMSDDIPASIGGDQPALLADGEFVIPADVVSGLGNGSTDAGARQLYAMMEAVRKARTGTDKQAPEIDSSRVMPA